MSHTVEVTFPVVLRLELDTATSRHALGALKQDLSDLVNDAGLGDIGDPRRPLCRLTPADTGDFGGFCAHVQNPTVLLPELVYEQDQASSRRISLVES